eukprot:2702962-Ditylum_brightwellii.AAC.1
MPDTIAQLMAHFLAHQQQQTQQPPTGEITEKPEDMYGMSTTEMDSMLVMCGFYSSAYDKQKTEYLFYPAIFLTLDVRKPTGQAAHRQPDFL